MFRKIASAILVCTATFPLLSCVENPTKNDAVDNRQGTTSPFDAKPSESALKTDTSHAEPKSEALKKFASDDVDKECKNLYISSTLEENLQGMAEFSAKVASLKAIGSLKSNLASGNSASQSSAIKAKELIWYYSKKYVWLPMSLEKEYGERVSSQLNDELLPRDGKYKKDYEYAESVLDEVLKGVHDKHDYQFKIYLARDLKNPAMAIAGGNIFVEQGFLKENRKNRDLVYFSIAHEISHILQRHETKHIQTMIMDAVDLKDSYKFAAGLKSPDVLRELLTPILSGKFLFAKNYSDQELQADSCALRIANESFGSNKTRIRSTKDAFIRFLKSKPKHAKEDAKQTVGAGNIIELLSSPIEKHPTSEERISNLAELSAKLAPPETTKTDPAPLNKKSKGSTKNSKLDKQQ